MEYIELETWKRKEHFEFFHRMDYPQYNICANIDVTHFLKAIKEKSLPFYYAMIFASTYAANLVPNFRYRIREGKVVLHDTVHPSFTEMSSKDDDLFKYVLVDMGDDMVKFVREAKKAAENQKCYFDFEKQKGRDDLVYITCLPWISFTQMTHTISLDRDDAAPRISWGKYFEQNGKTLLPFSVQVNHAFVDGIHVGRYFEELQKYIDNL
jgi:chloramphenicol O-acetyltransferase type A